MNTPCDILPQNEPNPSSTKHRPSKEIKSPIDEEDEEDVASCGDTVRSILLFLFSMVFTFGPALSVLYGIISLILLSICNNAYSEEETVESVDYEGQMESVSGDEYDDDDNCYLLTSPQADPTTIVGYTVFALIFHVFCCGVIAGGNHTGVAKYLQSGRSEEDPCWLRKSFYYIARFMGLWILYETLFENYIAYKMERRSSIDDQWNPKAIQVHIGSRLSSTTVSRAQQSFESSCSLL